MFVLELYWTTVIDANCMESHTTLLTNISDSDYLKLNPQTTNNNLFRRPLFWSFHMWFKFEQKQVQFVQIRFSRLKHRLHLINNRRTGPTRYCLPGLRVSFGQALRIPPSPGQFLQKWLCFVTERAFLRTLHRYVLCVGSFVSTRLWTSAHCARGSVWVMTFAIGRLPSTGCL